MTHIDVKSFQLEGEATIEVMLCGQGPRPLIFIPGGGDGLMTPSQGPLRLWRWLDGPRHRYFRTLYVSRRSSFEGVSLEQQADDIAYVLRQLDWPASLVEAQSAGGMLGVEFALRYPEYAKALVLSSSTARLDTQTRALIEVWTQMLREQRWDQFIQSAFFNLWPIEKRALLRPFGNLLLKLAQPRDTTRMLALLEQLATQDLRPKLGGLTQPVLITGGRQDRIFPQSLQLEMADLIPNTTTVFQDNFGHGNDMENPAHARLIAAFARMHIPRHFQSSVVA